jgi:hypothetical protein
VSRLMADVVILGCCYVAVWYVSSVRACNKLQHAVLPAFTGTSYVHNCNGC